MGQALKGDGKAIFTIFIGVIIALVFITSFSDNVFTQTNTASTTNLTVTVAAINTSLAVEGRDLIEATSVINATNLSQNLITRGLSLTDGIVDGVKTVILVANDTSGSVGSPVNLTYTYNPDGYISNSGGRSIAALIIIISALAILVFVVVVLSQSGASLGNFMGKGNKGRRK